MFKEKVEEIIGKRVEDVKLTENCFFLKMTDGTICELTKDDFGLLAVHFVNIWNNILKLKGEIIKNIYFDKRNEIEITTKSKGSVTILLKGITKIKEIKKSPSNQEALIKVTVLMTYTEKEISFQCLKQDEKWVFSTFFKDGNEEEFKFYKKLAQDMDLCNHKEVRIKLIV